MSEAPDGRFSGDLGKDYGNEDESDVPPPIREARDMTSYWRQVVGVTEGGAEFESELAAQQVPSAEDAIRFYHQWIIEFHNRLRDYESQIAGEDARKWWNERAISIRTWRGLDHISVTVRAGALDLLNEILDRDEDNSIETGTRVTLHELQGLRSLIFARSIRSTVELDAGSARNPDRTEQRRVPDWLDADSLMACHDGLNAVTADLGFTPKASSIVSSDTGTIHGE